MKTKTLIIPAGGQEDFAIVGDYVRIKSASVPVRIQANNGQTDATIEQGDALNLKPFERLTLSHAGAAEQTIVLLVGDGTSTDSAKVGGSVAVSGVVATTSDPIAIGFETNTAAAVTSTVLRPNDPTRKFLSMQNTGATNIWFRFTDTGNAAVGVGFLLGPGASATYANPCPTTRIMYISDAPGGYIAVVAG